MRTVFSLVEARVEILWRTPGSNELVPLKKLDGVFFIKNKTFEIRQITTCSDSKRSYFEEL